MGAADAVKGGTSKPQVCCWQLPEGSPEQEECWRKEDLRRQAKKIRNSDFYGVGKTVPLSTSVITGAFALGMIGMRIAGGGSPGEVRSRLWNIGPIVLPAATLSIASLLTDARNTLKWTLGTGVVAGIAATTYGFVYRDDRHSADKVLIGTIATVAYGSVLASMLDEDATVRKARDEGLIVQPTVTPDGAGISVAGTF